MNEFAGNISDFRPAPMTETQRIGVEMYKAGSRKIFGLTGDSQRQTRQTIMRMVTGEKLPASKCGINALSAKVRELDPTIERY